MNFKDRHIEWYVMFLSQWNINNWINNTRNSSHNVFPTLIYIDKKVFACFCASIRFLYASIYTVSCIYTKCCIKSYNSFVYRIHLIAIHIFRSCFFPPKCECAFNWFCSVRVFAFQFEKKKIIQLKFFKPISKRLIFHINRIQNEYKRRHVNWKHLKKLHLF